MSYEDEVGEMIEGLVEQARVHDRQKCVGLPYCCSCRAVVILKHELTLLTALAWMETVEEGTIVRLEE